MWSWVLGHGSLPTTPAGVEAGAVAVFLGIRFVDLAQLAIALPVSLRHSTHPTVFAVVLAGFVAESVLLAVVLIRSGRYTNRRWGVVDASAGVSALLLQPAFTAPGDVTGDWTAWAFACTLSTAVGTGIVFGRRREFGLVVVSLAVSYLGTALLRVPMGSVRATVLGNTLAYPGFALLARFLLGYLRRLAADAEDARDRAATAAAVAARLREVERQRLLLHDNISVLRLLADPDLPDELGEPLRSQAATLSNRVRAFLDDSRSGAHAGDMDTTAASCPQLRALVHVVREALAGFEDLPVEPSLDLAEGVLVTGPAAEAFSLAVATVLANIRVHARARAVVVHADANEEEGEWEVTIADDGRGFDPAATPTGFGLRIQVEQNLAGHGISAHVHSAPDEGTRVTLRGALVPDGRRAQP